jgi:hypothetical protein
MPLFKAQEMLDNQGADSILWPCEYRLGFGGNFKARGTHRGASASRS